MAAKKSAARVRFVAQCGACGKKMVGKDNNAYHGTRTKATNLAIAHFERKHLTITEKKVTIERDVRLTVTEIG